MFFDDKNSGLVNDTQKVAENIDMANLNLKKFATRMKDSVINVQNTMNQAFAINSKAAETIRQTLGQTRVVSTQVQDVIAQSTKSTGLLGINAEKNLELFAALNASMQRNTYFTDEQITKFQALGFNANMTAQQLAEMATSFDTLGYTTDETLEMMSDMTKEARSYGVNVSSFMDQVNKNLKLMVTYNFKEGVAGLSKMVAQAQALRIDMSKTVSFADDLLSPEKAIETAAGFQMLGGAVGALGDPFQLLHMAQTDVAGLQDSLVDMAAGAVSFNKETGEFDIPVTQMYRLKEAAQLAGMSYQEFSEMAMNAAQRTEKIKLLDQFNTVPEEQKELIASLGKIGANGNLEITMPDGTVKKIGEGFNELVGSDYSELQKMLDVNNMSELDVAKASMGYLDEIKNAQDTLVKLTTLNLVQSGGFETFGENISKAQELLTQSFLERESQVQLPESVVSAVGTATTLLKIDDKTQTDRFAQAVVDGINTFSSAIDNTLVPALEKFDFEKMILKPMEMGWNNIVDAIDGLDWFNIDTSGRVTITGTPERDVSDGTGTPSGIPNRDVVVPEPVNAPQRDVPVSETTSTPQRDVGPIELVVSGNVELNLEGIPTGSSLTAESLAAALNRNPTAISIIQAQLNNSLNNYG